MQTPVKLDGLGSIDYVKSILSTIGGLLNGLIEGVKEFLLSETFRTFPPLRFGASFEDSRGILGIVLVASLISVLSSAVEFFTILELLIECLKRVIHSIERLETSRTMAGMQGLTPRRPHCQPHTSVSARPVSIIVVHVSLREDHLPGI
jgi:hypothetical protein